MEEYFPEVEGALGDLIYYLWILDFFNAILSFYGLPLGLLVLALKGCVLWFIPRKFLIPLIFMSSVPLIALLIHGIETAVLLAKHLSFYFLLLVASVYCRKKHLIRSIQIFQMVVFSAFIFSLIFQQGYPTYSESRWGITSFYTAGNDLGYAIVLNTLAGFYLLTERRLTLFCLLGFLILIFIGSRFSVISAIVLAIGMGVTRGYGLRLAFFGGAVLSLAEVLFSVSELFSFVVQRISFMEILIPRLGAITAGINFLSSFNLLEALFGSGTDYYSEIASQMQNQFPYYIGYETTSFESDLFDVFALLGAIGVLMYAAFWVIAVRIGYGARIDLVVLLFFLYCSLSFGHFFFSAQVLFHFFLLLRAIRYSRQ